MFKNIKITNKILLMISIPIFGLIYLTISISVEKWSIVNEMNSLNQLSILAVNSSTLAHELQEERAFSDIFLNKPNQQFFSKVVNQKVKTNSSIYFFKNFNNLYYNKFDSEIKNNINDIFSILSQLEIHRQAVKDLKISAEENNQYYTKLINLVLDNINYLSLYTNTYFSNQAFAYINLLRAIENIQLERSLLYHVFEDKLFIMDLYKKFTFLVETQKVYINDFLFFASSNQKQYYYDITPFFKKIKDIKQIAFSQELKWPLVMELHHQSGYGGLIHQFKNYLLRGEPKYIDQFYQQYNKTQTLFAKYKNIPNISALDLSNIDIIEKNFEQYKQYLTKIVKLKQQAKSIEEIDKILKIDDTPTIKAFHFLLNGGYLGINATEWWELTSKSILLLKQLEERIASDLQLSTQNLKNNAKFSFVSSIAILLITILLSLIIIYSFVCSINKPLKKLVNIANLISAGKRDINIEPDFESCLATVSPIAINKNNLQFDPNSKDEIKQLFNTITQMLSSINQSELTLQNINQSYARFVPNEFLKLLNKTHIEDIQLSNNIEMNMTVLFSDIRSFTKISEKMSPQESFNFINTYLKEISPVIRQHNGIIDKYIGDAIMALFVNADDALKAAIGMLNKLTLYNQKQKQPVKIGIGLNTGSLMLGVVGEERRLQCTVISDSVNLASRLENITKTYKTPLLISENTLKNLADKQQYKIRFLDKVKVKGRFEPINIFEVFDMDSTIIQQAKIASLENFERAVYLYQKHKFAQVIELMNQCLEQNPQDAAANVYIQRCQSFLNINEMEHWEKIATAIEWTPKLSVNNQIIDGQHRELFVRMQGLVMSIGANKAKEEVGEMIQFLEVYAIDHLRLEENYMRKYNYPQYKIHKARHEQFINNLENIKQHYLKKGASLYLTLKIQDEIVEWFSHHIKKMDVKLASFLKQN